MLDMLKVHEVCWMNQSEQTSESLLRSKAVADLPLLTKWVWAFAAAEPVCLLSYPTLFTLDAAHASEVWGQVYTSHSYSDSRKCMWFESMDKTLVFLLPGFMDNPVLRMLEVHTFAEWTSVSVFVSCLWRVGLWMSWFLV